MKKTTVKTEKNNNLNISFLIVSKLQSSLKHDFLRGSEKSKNSKNIHIKRPTNKYPYSRRGNCGNCFLISKKIKQITKGKAKKTNNVFFTFGLNTPISKGFGCLLFLKKISKRAIDELNKGGNGKYHVLFNNCESFANRVFHGHSISWQSVGVFILIAGVGLLLYKGSKAA